MNQVQIKSFKSVLDTGLVDVELQISLPTGIQRITIPVSDDLLRVCAEARGEVVWSEPDIAVVVSKFLADLSENVVWKI